MPNGILWLQIKGDLRQPLYSALVALLGDGDLAVQVRALSVSGGAMNGRWRGWEGGQLRDACNAMNEMGVCLGGYPAGSLPSAADAD